MQRHTTRFGMWAVTAIVLVGLGANTAAAGSPTPAEDPPPAAVPTVTTLPLFGAPLTVEVTTGPGGTLATIDVNPADGWTATKLKPNKVRFVNAEGTARVSVGSKHGGQKVEARAGSLADVSGDGGWSGDVFGTGAVTTVSFTIGATADGGPDITNVASSDPTAQIGATEHKSDDDDGEVEQKASAKIVFTSGGQSRALSIKAEVETDDDGETHAKVKVSLGRLRAVAVPVEDATGDATWTGQLCDGSVATIDYTVDEGGSLTLVGAAPEPERVKTEGGNIDVRFGKDARVRIKAHLGEGGITVKVDEKIRCRDAEPPEVNTPTSTEVEDDRPATARGDDQRSGGDDDRKGGRGDERKGKGD